MASFEDVEGTITKDDKEIGERSESFEEDLHHAKSKTIKTKYEDGKDRHFYMKTKPNSEESGSNLDNSLSISEESENNKSLKSESLTSIELRRLKDINGRASRLVFSGIWELPDQRDIKDLNPDILFIVEAKNRAPSCFCIFTDTQRKAEAEKKLNGRKFGRGFIEVDRSRSMVPVDTSDLDSTRELRTLAVHGIGRDVTVKDLEEAFPCVREVKIAHRGGSAFLKYRDDRSCSKAFLEAEVKRVGGYRVQVLFGHVIEKNKRRLSLVSPVHSKRFLPSECLARKELTSISREFSLRSTKTESKVDIKSLLLVLDEAGLQMEELQSDYIKGGCDPGSGPNIRTAWMDHLKNNTDNKLSRSSRMDLVDNVWNFFDDDEDTQQRLKTEKKRMESEKSRKSGKESSILSIGREKIRKNEKADDVDMNGSYIGREINFSPNRKRGRSSEYSYRADMKIQRSSNSDRKNNRSFDYNYSPDKRGSRYKESPDMRRKRYREQSSTSQKETHESGKNARYNSRDSSWYRDDVNVESTKDRTQKIKYGRSSQSTSPRGRESSKCDSTQKKDYVRYLMDGKARDERSFKNDLKTEETKIRSQNKPSQSVGENNKCEQKLKKSRSLELESDIRQSRIHSKAKMMIAKTVMMKKLKDKSQDSKLGNKVLRKYKKVLGNGKKKQIEGLKKKEETVQPRIQESPNDCKSSEGGMSLDSGINSPGHGKSFGREKSPSTPLGREKSPSAPRGREKSPWTPLSREKSPCTPLGREKSPCTPLGRQKSPSTPLGRQKSPSTPLGRVKSPYTPRGREKSPSAPRGREKSPCTSLGREKSPSTLRGREKSPYTPLGREKSPCTPRGREKSPSTPLGREKSPSTPLGREKSPSTPLGRQKSPSTPLGREKCPANVLKLCEGFPRMALVMAGRLEDTCDMDQQMCKAMAASMVAVWTKYGFSYNQLREMYNKEKERDSEATPDDVSLLGMRKLLHSSLRKKVKEGQQMPKKFGFSVLIDLTMFYFEKGI